jgi:hypothetical protein
LGREEVAVHEISWTITEHGAIAAHLECLGPGPKGCRMVCSAGCEVQANSCGEGFALAHSDWDGGQLPLHHQVTDVDYCVALEAMSLAHTAIQDAYDGPTFPLHDGRIDLIWKDGCWTWRYCECT